MSFLDKVKFWKKDDYGGDFNLDSGDMGLDSKSDPLGAPPGMNNDPFGAPPGTDSTPPSDPFSQPEQPFTPQQPPGFGGPSQQAYPQQPFQPYQQYNQPTIQPISRRESNEYSVAKEVEIMSSKLDALRASIDAINQRLANLERIAEGEQSRSRYRW